MTKILAETALGQSFTGEIGREFFESPKITLRLPTKARIIAELK